MLSSIPAAVEKVGENPSISARKLAERIVISDRKVKPHITKLRKSGSCNGLVWLKVGVG